MFSARFALSSVIETCRPYLEGQQRGELFLMERLFRRGSAAVLLIFILIFTWGACKLGSYLHKKLTSA